MATVKEIYHFLDEKAPFCTQLEFDNAGFLVGRGEARVDRVLVALDITAQVAEEAARLGAQLVVSHHPVIFHPVRSITDRDPVGGILLALAEGHIAAICAHTNLDAARGGVNDALAQALGLISPTLLKGCGNLPDGAPYGIERIGTLPGEPISLPEFAGSVKAALGANGVRYVDAGKPVHRVAVGGGACADSLGEVASAGCDTFVTSDVKYHQFLEAHALGVNLVDAGHYPTENVVCPRLVSWLKEGYPRLQVTQSLCHREIYACL